MPHPDIHRVVLDADLSCHRNGLVPGVKGTTDPLATDFPNIARPDMPVVAFDNGVRFPVMNAYLRELPDETKRHLTEVSLATIKSELEFLIERGCGLVWLETQIKRCIDNAQAARRRKRRRTKKAGTKPSGK